VIPMEFMDVVAARKSVRKYSDAPVEDEKIARCLEAARLAPSWRNLQCWRFIVVKDKDTIAGLANLINLWLKSAPAVIVACAAPSKSGVHNGQSYYLVDTAIALEHIVLAATNEGLGTCWIGGFDEAKFKAALGIPKEIRVVAMTPLGYPAEKEGLWARGAKALMGRRKTIDEIVHREKW
jgi:nitroreductase